MDQLYPQGWKAPGEDKPPSRISKFFSWIMPFIFYLTLAGIVVVIFSTGNSEGAPRKAFGYSMFTVISGSMRPEIPIDSFVLVKDVAPDQINAGDIITYLRRDGTIITHSVIEVLENYTDNGERGFRTQGINNPAPDEEIVFAGNVIGQVVFHNATLGKILTWLQGHIGFTAAFILTLMALGAVLRYLANEGKKGGDVSQEQNRW